MLIASFVPKKLPYTVKIIIYALISSLVFIPVRVATHEFYRGAIDRIGIYFPLLAVNSLIVLQSEAKFFRMPRVKMFFSLVFYVIGFDIVMLLTGLIRELIAYGTINGRVADVDMPVYGLSQPFGGFIFLGLMCGGYRYIRKLLRREAFKISYHSLNIAFRILTGVFPGVKIAVSAFPCTEGNVDIDTCITHDVGSILMD